jgi:hypothetical protein
MNDNPIGSLLTDCEEHNNVALGYLLVTVIDSWYCGAQGTTTALH